MDNYNWDKLSALQIGKYAEYYAKMEFTLFGWDVYSPELDDKGIDMILRKNSTFIEAQVKSVRLEKTNYVFMPKSKFAPHKGLVLCLVLFENQQPPRLHLIPSEAWYQPDDLLADMNYGAEKKSEPEYGLRLSRKNLPILEKYRFQTIVEQLSVVADYAQIDMASAATLLADDYEKDSELTAFSVLDSEDFYEQR